MSLTNVTSAVVGSLITSADYATITGTTGDVQAVIVRGQGNPQLRVNADGDWVKASAVQPGDRIYLRMTASASVSTTLTATLYLPNNQSLAWTVTSAAGDADADAYLTASGNDGDSTISAATYTIFASLKTASIYSKLKAMYLFAGGTAAKHKWNAINPVDTDAGFRITFSGTITHNTNGITGDGSTGYGDTHFDPTTAFASNANGSAGVYSRTDSATGSNPYDMGCCTSSDTNNTIVIAKYSNSNAYLGYGSSTFPTTSGLSGSGMFIVSRSNSTTTKGYRNTTEIISATDTVVLESRNLYLCCCNRGGTASYFSPKNLAFAFIGDGLTATDVTNLYNAVQAFQTALGRNV